MRRLVPALIVSSALVLAACGGDDGGGSSGGGDSASDSSAAGGDTGEGGVAGNRFEVTLEDDSKLVVRLDVSASDATVAPFEAYRQLVNGPEVVWMVGEITPPAGVDSTGRFVTFVAAGKNAIDDDPMDDTDGIVSSTFACSLIDRWISAESAPELTDEISAEYNRMVGEVCGGQTLQVLAPGGQTTTYAMAYEGPALPEFERVYAGLAYEMSPAG
jgi:hypothetical protein